MGEVVADGVELPFPKVPVAIDPKRSVFHRAGDHAASMDPALLLTGEESCPFEHPEVLGDGGQRHGERLGQFRHRGLPTRQARKDRPTGRIGQGRKGGIEGA